MADLFEGDIQLPHEALTNTRLGLRIELFPERYWDNGIVPFVISNLYGSKEINLLRKSILSINFLTCVKFVPWNGVSTDYVLIMPNGTLPGCWSHLGRKEGPQIVHLSIQECFRSMGIPIHELLHSLGVLHEQSRWDRSKFVNIYWENIKSNKEFNFDKQSHHNATSNYRYDYESVMHYPRKAFSKNNYETITPIDPKVKIGQRTFISKLDCLKVNDMYGCMKEPRKRKVYYEKCSLHGY